MHHLKNTFCLSLLFLFINCSTGYKTLYVAPHTSPCSGVGKTNCLLVKTDKDQAEWKYFYTNIEGFIYEGGYDYELLIKESKIENPPADASSIQYTLIKIVSKTKKE